MRLNILAPIGIATTMLLVGAATPGFAADPDNHPDGIAAIAEVAPEVLGDAVPAETVGDELTATAGATQVVLPADTGEAVLYQAGEQIIEITLPAAASVGPAELADGLVTYDNLDGSITVPVPKEDGSLQITTVIGGPEAPTSYEYALGLPHGYELLTADEGEGIAIATTDKSDLLGVFAAPWAVDAEGRDVPTRYEIQGDTLVQIVDHTAGSFAYPIVADPWLGQELYYSPYLTSWNGAFKVNVTPRQAGIAWAGITTWWAHADEIKNKLAAKYPSRPASQRWNTNVQEQLYCHIAGLPFSLPEYNLEAARTFLYWESQVAYRCNYPEGYYSG